MDGLRAELQRRLTVEDEELPLKDLFTRGQYLEAAHHEGNQDASKGGGYRNQSKSNLHVYGRSTEKCYYKVNRGNSVMGAIPSLCRIFGRSW